MSLLCIARQVGGGHIECRAKKCHDSGTGHGRQRCETTENPQLSEDRSATRHETLQAAADNCFLVRRALSSVSSFVPYFPNSMSPAYHVIASGVM